MNKQFEQSPKSEGDPHQKLKSQEQNKSKLPRWFLPGIILVIISISIFLLSQNLRKEVPPTSADSLRAIGPETAPVVIAEYADFACITCRAWHQFGIKDRVIETYGDQVRFEWHDFPVTSPASPKAKFAASIHSTGKDGGHTINLHQFVKDGVILLGHIKNMQEDQIIMVPDLKENLAKADKFEIDFVKQIDDYIEKTGLDAPLDTLPKLNDGFEVEEILTLDLLTSGITSVIWATGFNFNFGFVKLPVFDEDGYPVQKRGVTEYPGLYFIGLPFLQTIKSGLLFGVGEDAAYVVEQMAPAIE